MQSRPVISQQKSGPQKALERLGLRSDLDLAFHLPLRHENESLITPIGRLIKGQMCQVQGTIEELETNARPKRQLFAKLVDSHGDSLILRFIHTYPALQKLLVKGTMLRARGQVRNTLHSLGGPPPYTKFEMVHPHLTLATNDTPLATELTPIYPTLANLPQAYLRKAVQGGLKRAVLDEVLPSNLIPVGLPNLASALTHLHYPSAKLLPAEIIKHNQRAWARLKFEELLSQQISQIQAKNERCLLKAPAFVVSASGLQEKILQVLPFDLTKAQERVVKEIAADLQKDIPMHRLLQGDVGSGKTVVAAISAALVIANGWQCALMAPTEILARQHFYKMCSWMERLGLKVAWLCGQMQSKERRATLAAIQGGEISCVVGTHAIIEHEVQFARLGLAIIDEQHRFGVAQRLALRNKLMQSQALSESSASTSPLTSQQQLAQSKPLEAHLLMMSATPIPRTLAMTVYADLDLSIIDELPPGRKPVTTKSFTQARRVDIIEQLRKELRLGRQAYWVCPLIQESEKLDLHNATATYQALSEALPDFAIGLLHGQLPAADKDKVMTQFIEGKLALLVSTTVIEVGVDVPNASLMIIEHAERFGLSQLHQLRGRVGRGEQASVCILLYSPPLSTHAKERLKAMLASHDGFEIARQDLAIRGPGEFLGARQSGSAMLRFADYESDGDLIEAARQTAQVLLEKHPQAVHLHLSRWRGIRSEYFKA